MYNVLTSFNLKYWNDIASTTIPLLDSRWPKEGRILLYHELQTIDKNLSARVDWIDLYKESPSLLKFIENWKDVPKANGFNGTNFRFNAVKFAHKTFAIWHAAKKIKDGWLFWIDCDASPIKEIDNSFFEKVCLESSGICYVGRPSKYSECGFLGFNLNNPEVVEFLTIWENLYLSGKFIEIEQTHDSWTFDHIRKNFKNQNLFFNLNSGALTDKNPFESSIIGTHFIHMKGEKKIQNLNKQKSRIL